MDITEEFLDKYKQLENLAVNEFHLPQDGSAISKIEKRAEFSDIKYELNYCREVRNLLQHNQKLDDEYAVTPSEKMVELLDTLMDRIKNPITCMDVAITFNELLWKSPDDLVLPTIRTMNDRNISHVPILRDKRVVGDFSDNCVFPFLLGDTEKKIDGKTRFRDLEEYLNLDAHPSEMFKFAAPDTKLYDVKKLYDEARRAHQRIGMVYITENGHPKGRLLGVLTSWLIVGC